MYLEVWRQTDKCWRNAFALVKDPGSTGFLCTAFVFMVKRYFLHLQLLWPHFRQQKGAKKKGHIGSLCPLLIGKPNFLRTLLQ